MLVKVIAAKDAQRKRYVRIETFLVAALIALLFVGDDQG